MGPSHCHAQAQFFFVPFLTHWTPLKIPGLELRPQKYILNSVKRSGRYNSILLKTISSPKFSKPQCQIGRDISPSCRLPSLRLPLLYADSATVPLPMVSTCYRVVSPLCSESVRALQHRSNLAVTLLVQI